MFTSDSHPHCRDPVALTLELTSFSIYHDVGVVMGFKGISLR